MLRRGVSTCWLPILRRNLRRVVTVCTNLILDGPSVCITGACDPIKHHQPFSCFWRLETPACDRLLKGFPESVNCFHLHWRHYETMKADTEVDYQEAIELLDSFVNYEKIGVPAGAGTDTADGFELGRVRQLLARLGSPIQHYKVVHVAGTKGKGSTVAFLSCILKAAGIRVGSFTSPHVTSLRERICVNGVPISPPAFAQLLQASVPAIKEGSGTLTHFETGLGGARDATNVIPSESLAAAVMTAIGVEHAAALGGTIESIARAKAGIAKEGRPLVIAHQPEAVANSVVQQVGTAKGALVVPVCHPRTSQYQIQANADGELRMVCGLEAHYSHGVLNGQPKDSPKESFRAEDLRLRLVGAHQLANAETAVTAALALRAQGYLISDAHIRQGLEAASIPGRFQVVGARAATAAGFGRATVVLDGAHTPASGGALRQGLGEAFPGRPVVFVVAMAADKDAAGFARALWGHDSFAMDSVSPTVAVVATEVPIGGGRTRVAPSKLLASVFEKESGGVESRGVGGGCGRQKEGAVSANSVLQEETLRMMDNGKEMLSHYEKRRFGKGGSANANMVVSEQDFGMALRLAGDMCEGLKTEKGVVCVTGSLHAIAAALRKFGLTNVE